MTTAAEIPDARSPIHAGSTSGRPLLVSIFKSDSLPHGYYTLSCDGTWRSAEGDPTTAFAAAEATFTAVVQVKTLFTRLVAEQVPIRRDFERAGLQEEEASSRTAPALSPHEALASVIAHGAVDLADPRLPLAAT